MRVQSEMASLKADNERLHKLVVEKGLSEDSDAALVTMTTSSSGPESTEKRFSLGSPTHLG